MKVYKNTGLVCQEKHLEDWSSQDAVKPIKVWDDEMGHKFGTGDPMAINNCSVTNCQ